MKRTGRPGSRSLARLQSPEANRRKRADVEQPGSGIKPHRITPADEELSDELLQIFHNPAQGWWSNRWVIDLADDGAPGEEQSHRTP